MPRALRIEYPGAIYHVTNRGDCRVPVFLDDLDRNAFREALAETCVRTGWQIHAYCLLPNHFHLAVETPEPNLTAGMHGLLATYTRRFRRRYQSAGGLFGGRFRALLVDHNAPACLRTVCDHIHLNPARARLLRPHEPLNFYQWSSWPDHLRAAHQRPPWLRVDRLRAAEGIPADDEAGRRELARRLELRRLTEDEQLYKPIRRGRFIGGEDFRAWLQELWQARGRGGAGADAGRAAAEQKARRIIAEEMARLAWPLSALAAWPKSDPRKVRLAQRLRAETSVTVKWIGAELHMGPGQTVANQLHKARVREAAENQSQILERWRDED